MVIIAVCPGFKVTGVVIPIAPNKEPATEIDEIVTGAVPDAVTATGAVAVVPTATLPNDTDGLLTVNAGEPLAGDRAIAKVVVTPPACAVMIAVWGAFTAAIFALNPAVAAPDLTVAFDGTVTAELLLDRFTRIRLAVVEDR